MIDRTSGRQSPSTLQPIIAEDGPPSVATPPGAVTSPTARGTETTDTLDRGQQPLGYTSSVSSTPAGPLDREPKLGTELDAALRRLSDDAHRTAQEIPVALGNILQHLPPQLDAALTQRVAAALARGCAHRDELPESKPRARGDIGKALVKLEDALAARGHAATYLRELTGPRLSLDGHAARAHGAWDRLDDAASSGVRDALETRATGGSTEAAHDALFLLTELDLDAVRALTRRAIDTLAGGGAVPSLPLLEASTWDAGPRLGLVTDPLIARARGGEAVDLTSTALSDLWAGGRGDLGGQRALIEILRASGATLDGDVLRLSGGSSMPLDEVFRDFSGAPQSFVALERALHADPDSPLLRALYGQLLEQRGTWLGVSHEARAAQLDRNLGALARSDVRGLADDAAQGRLAGLVTQAGTLDASGRSAVLERLTDHLTTSPPSVPALETAIELLASLSGRDRALQGDAIGDRIAAAPSADVPRLLWTHLRAHAGDPGATAGYELARLATALPPDTVRELAEQLADQVVHGNASARSWAAGALGRFADCLVVPLDADRLAQVRTRLETARTNVPVALLDVLRRAEKRAVAPAIEHL